MLVVEKIEYDQYWNYFYLSFWLKLILKWKSEVFVCVPVSNMAAVFCQLCWAQVVCWLSGVLGLI